MVRIRAAKTNTTKLVVARKLVAVAVAVARADATSLSSITVTRQLGGVRPVAAACGMHPRVQCVSKLELLWVLFTSLYPLRPPGNKDVSGRGKAGRSG